MNKVPFTSKFSIKEFISAGNSKMGRLAKYKFDYDEQATQFSLLGFTDIQLVHQFEVNENTRFQVGPYTSSTLCKRFDFRE